MAPRPRLVTLLRTPDVVSLTNTALGFLGITAVISGNTQTAARLVLIAGVADGLDGRESRSRRIKKALQLASYLDHFVLFAIGLIACSMTRYAV